MRHVPKRTDLRLPAVQQSTGAERVQRAARKTPDKTNARPSSSQPRACLAKAATLLVPRALARCAEACVRGRHNQPMLHGQSAASASMLDYLSVIPAHLETCRNVARHQRPGGGEPDDHQSDVSVCEGQRRARMWTGQPPRPFSQTIQLTKVTFPVSTS
jgi:hypothetical protein